MIDRSHDLPIIKQVEVLRISRVAEAELGALIIGVGPLDVLYVDPVLFWPGKLEMNRKAARRLVVRSAPALWPPADRLAGGGAPARASARSF